jgi:hypothetical protein
MKNDDPCAGVKSLDDAVSFAKTIGVGVGPVRRTGELCFYVINDPAHIRFRVNGRRKDASQALVGFLRRIAKRRLP